MLPFTNDAILSSLWTYWEAKRGARSIPLRRDIDPVEIPRLLPHLQLVERVKGRGFRFRLTGTAVVQGYGFDPTGKFTHEILSPARHRIARGHFSLVYESGRPLFARNRYVKGGSLLAMVSRMILPLSLEGEKVAMLLIGYSFGPAKQSTVPVVGVLAEVGTDEFEFIDTPAERALDMPVRIAALR